MSDTQSYCHSANSFADRVFEALRGHGQLWLSGLALPLAASSPAWSAFDEGREYGTARFLTADPTGSRVVVGEIAIGGHGILIEILPEDLGVHFDRLAPVQAVGSGELVLLRAAAALLNDIPDLAAAVGGVVRSLHVLCADESYDVSHSEPTIPFSIFVSVPGSKEKDAILRLAESIVHEAMHLQLTLVENVCPLVATEGEGFSPWQGSDRPVRGLLHGLYVFAVISRFMDVVAKSQPDLARKARQRRAEIEEEVASLEDFDVHLTAAGRILSAACLNVVGGCVDSRRGRHAA